MKRVGTFGWIVSVLPCIMSMATLQAQRTYTPFSLPCCCFEEQSVCPETLSATTI
jgi:hypothetical protein